MPRRRREPCASHSMLLPVIVKHARSAPWRVRTRTSGSELSNAKSQRHQGEWCEIGLECCVNTSRQEPHGYFRARCKRRSRRCRWRLPNTSKGTRDVFPSDQMGNDMRAAVTRSFAVSDCDLPGVEASNLVAIVSRRNQELLL